MPKKKVAQIVRKPKEKSPKAPAPSEDLSQFPPGFENKAGRYELIRVDAGQAYYSFTNHQEKTVDATMSVVTWRKMQERAAAAYNEIA
jgi:hypothetical protein